MHRPTIRAKRQLAEDLDRRFAAQVPAHPREAAVAFIRGQIDDHLAGLDSYDSTILVLDAHPFEAVWANRALEIVGIVLDKRMWAGAIRYRAIVEADVRAELGLDGPDAPTLVEPLASRAASSAQGSVMDAIVDVLPDRPPVLHAVEREPLSSAAIRAAKDAYDRHRIAEKGRVH